MTITMLLTIAQEKVNQRPQPKDGGNDNNIFAIPERCASLNLRNDRGIRLVNYFL
jgi:hypothetical protein